MGLVPSTRGGLAAKTLELAVVRKVEI